MFLWKYNGYNQHRRFDVTRKDTYRHLKDWLKELREYCPNIPVICIANKVDINYKARPTVQYMCLAYSFAVLS